MKPAKRIRHIESKHKDLMGKPVEFFKRKEIELKSDTKSIKTCSIQDKVTLKACFIVLLRIVQAKKPYCNW